VNVQTRRSRDARRGTPVVEKDRRKRVASWQTARVRPELLKKKKKHKKGRPARENLRAGVLTMRRACLGVTTTCRRQQYRKLRSPRWCRGLSSRRLAYKDGAEYVRAAHEEYSGFLSWHRRLLCMQALEQTDTERRPEGLVWLTLLARGASDAADGILDDQDGVSGPRSGTPRCCTTTSLGACASQATVS